MRENAPPRVRAASLGREENAAGVRRVVRGSVHVARVRCDGQEEGEELRVLAQRRSGCVRVVRARYDGREGGTSAPRAPAASLEREEDPEGDLRRREVFHLRSIPAPTRRLRSGSPTCPCPASAPSPAVSRATSASLCSLSAPSGGSVSSPSIPSFSAEASLEGR